MIEKLQDEQYSNTDIDDELIKPFEIINCKSSDHSSDENTNVIRENWVLKIFGKLGAKNKQMIVSEIISKLTIKELAKEFLSHIF